MKSVLEFLVDNQSVLRPECIGDPLDNESALTRCDPLRADNDFDRGNLM